jgi:hypothetical protein
VFEVTAPVVLIWVVALLILAGVTNRLRGGHLVAVAIFSIYLVGAAHFLILPLQHNPIWWQRSSRESRSRWREWST